MTTPKNAGRFTTAEREILAQCDGNLTLAQLRVRLAAESKLARRAKAEERAEAKERSSIVNENARLLVALEAIATSNDSTSGRMIQTARAAIEQSEEDRAVRAS